MWWAHRDRASDKSPEQSGVIGMCRGLTYMNGSAKEPLMAIFTTLSAVAKIAMSTTVKAPSTRDSPSLSLHMNTS